MDRKVGAGNVDQYAVRFFLVICGMTVSRDPKAHEDYARCYPQRGAANVTWKVDAAMGCLGQGETLVAFYGEVSVAIGQAASAYK